MRLKVLLPVTARVIADDDCVAPTKLRVPVPFTINDPGLVKEIVPVVLFVEMVPELVNVPELIPSVMFDVEPAELAVLMVPLLLKLLPAPVIEMV